MAASLQTRTEEETKTPRKDAIVSSGGGGETAYFISINIRQPKIRIKLPKLLAKALQRRRNHKFKDAESADNSKSKKRWGGKVGSIVSDLFGGGGKKITKPEASSDSPREIVEEREAKRSENDEDRRRNGLGFDINGGRAGSSESARVPIRKMRNGRSVRKKWITDRARFGEEAELCKKRILMGEKCRPLNLSGKLNYDKNGVLLAEEVNPLKEF
ncbi:hypothetical protein U1Q18_004284 [Sarracenia purpurea var. burkii]